MKLLVKRLTKTACLPAYAHSNDAGMDVFADETIDILPQQRALVRTGIALEIPPGYVVLVWDKSGVAVKAGVTTFAGVIDAGYRGEVQIVLYNSAAETHHITAGQKIAQLLLQPVEHADIREVTDLTETSRGGDGFGSTGI